MSKDKEFALQIRELSEKDFRRSLIFSVIIICLEIFDIDFSDTDLFGLKIIINELYILNGFLGWCLTYYLSLGIFYGLCSLSVYNTNEVIKNSLIAHKIAFKFINILAYLSGGILMIITLTGLYLSIIDMLRVVYLLFSSIFS